MRDKTLKWLNSESRKNWELIILNLILTLTLSLIIIPSVIYFNKLIMARTFIFEGTIINVDSVPIKNAELIIEGLGIGLSNDKGQFKIKTKEQLKLGDLVYLEILPPDTTTYKIYKEKFEISSLQMKNIKILIEYAN